jgi:hypothetical protein
MRIHIDENLEANAHRVDRVLSFFSSRRDWDSPAPSTAGKCALPPLVRRGRTRLRERGWVSPNSDEATKTVVFNTPPGPSPPPRNTWPRHTYRDSSGPPVRNRSPCGWGGGGRESRARPSSYRLGINGTGRCEDSG